MINILVAGVRRHLDHGDAERVGLPAFVRYLYEKAALQFFL
jgi:hypothetical protein